MRQVLLEQLTEEAFEPFGHVVSHTGAGRRSMIATDHVAGGRPLLWLARVGEEPRCPLTFKTLERHPYSSQSFIPRGNFPHLVVVALGTAGEPDIATLRGFLASGSQGVTYARNCWHLGLVPLVAPSEFVVSMVETDDPDQTVMADLADECAVLFPAPESEDGAREMECALSGQNRVPLHGLGKK